VQLFDANSDHFHFPNGGEKPGLNEEKTCHVQVPWEYYTQSEFSPW